MTHEQMASGIEEYQIKVPYTNCDTADFTRYGFSKYDRNLKDKIKYRLCPTYSENYKRLFLKNNQPNVRERAYTAVKVRKCSEEIDKVTCASDTQIEKLLD